MVNFIMLLFAGVFTGEDRQENTGGFNVDQRGKYVIYQELIEENIDLSTASFEDYVKNYFQDKGEEVMSKKENRLYIKGKTRLQKHAGIGNYIAGDIEYKFVLEKGNDGYRFWFTDLVYQPYIKDRYGKIVPAEVNAIPLEKSMSKINEAVWLKQRQYAFETMRLLANKLNEHLGRINEPQVLTIE